MLRMKYRERKGIWVIKTDDLGELYRHLSEDLELVDRLG